MATPTIDEWGLVRSEQEETEESYFVSMTDIMVGLLFIFIIMLMAFSLMLKIAAEKQTKTREDVLKVVEDNRDRVKQMRSLDSYRAAMLHDVERRLKAQGVEVIVDEANGVLRLPDEILFDSGLDQLTDEGLVKIGHLARALEEVLPCYAIAEGQRDRSGCPQISSENLRLEAVFIEGHTDSVGPDEVNWGLSARRAINTYRALEQRSTVSTELKNDRGQRIFSVAGYGENRPVVEEIDDDARRRNRRIDLRFVMNVSHEEALKQVQTSLEDVLEER